MNERLKAVRKALGLNQSEFGKRLGVGNTTISKIEIGENNLTEQMIVAVCREFSISENWLRTGEGEMRIATKDALIQQMADAYNLDELDIAYIEGYINLPPAMRSGIKAHLSAVSREYQGDTEFDGDFMDGVIAAVDEAEERNHAKLNRPLTNQEQAARLRAHADVLEKGEHSSTTYGNSVFTPRTSKAQSGA